MSLYTRLASAMIALVVLTAIAVGVLTYRNIVAESIPRILDRLDSHAQLLALSVDSSVQDGRAESYGQKLVTG